MEIFAQAGDFARRGGRREASSTFLLCCSVKAHKKNARSYDAGVFM